MKMLNIFVSQKKLLRITLLLCVLFSLAPCSVKSSFFTVLDVEHSLPFNKTKTTQISSFSDCSLSQSVVSITKQYSKTAPDLFNFSDDKEHLFFSNTVSKKHHFEKLTSGNSPPLYILYKRLKLNLA